MHEQKKFLQELKADIIENWITEDGLMAISQDDKREGWMGSPYQSVDNQNGILFVVYFYLMLHKLDMLEKSDIDRFCKAVRLLEARDKDGNPIPGLYHRNHMHDDLLESKDNYLAICAFSKIAGLGFHKDIFEYGIQYGFTFDNVQKKYNPRKWRQGETIALYGLCYEFTPRPLDILWLAGAFTHNALLQKPSGDENRAGEYLQKWIRVCLIDFLNEDRPESVADEVFDFIGMFTSLWKMKLELRTNGVGLYVPMRTYFKDPKMPLPELARYVNI